MSKRHFYIRLCAGLVWLAGAVVAALNGSILFSLFELALGVAFLCSARNIQKKARGHR